MGGAIYPLNLHALVENIGTTSRPILPRDFGKFQTHLTKRRITASLSSLINYTCVTNNKNLKCTYHPFEV